MPTTTQQQYFENPDLHGNYQFIPYTDILNTLELLTEDDSSHLKNINRSQLILHSKRAIKEFARQVPTNILAIEVEIGQDLYFPLPQDFVNWRRISVVEYNEGAFYLRPLDVNEAINTATGYLQDNNLELLFDANGEILTADSANAYNHPYKKYQFIQNGSNDMQQVSVYGEFKVDRDRGRILFSSEMADKIVVIEYVSDGLQAEVMDKDILVHKYLEQAVIDFTYYHCVRFRRSDSVPANEKERARREMQSSLHKAKLALMNFDFKAVRRAVRT